jgi:glutathione synthase/RimK-type ligase-like ATP-grasp enzyme
MEATNHSKLQQSVHIARSGFLVPDSLVTNDPAMIREFQAHHGRIVYKSMSGIRSVVKEFSAEHLTGAPLGPVLFQQLVKGNNVRVHVVGEEVFCCSIVSDAVDYRYAEARIHGCSLPDEVAERCLALARRLGLVLAGLDLIVTSEQQWYCLEANPNPGFSYFDRSPKKVIARAVAKLLLSG